ncbi:MAG TPA: CHAP domain-containing protein [Ktedonobacterales bacterium]|nr:CHAP domain-containing protein [Ktedonobacterales bacterium]
MSGSRRRTTIGPAPSGATGEQLAISSDGDETRTTSRRRITSARPVRAEDKALVAATTQMLRAIEVVQDDAIDATNRLPALHEDVSVVPFEEPETAVVPVTVVPATLAPAPAWLTHRPRRRRRSLVSGVLTGVMALGLLLGVLQTVSPIGAAPAQLQQFTLINGQLGADGNLPPPAGPWDTSAGVADTLGLGGGAAPGTNAPGSAGLPSTGKPSNSGSNNAGPSTHISPAPLSHWPPADQFHTYPPGYSSFSVSRPADNYYWWAFGQCTWWAQNKRRDENLRHMGNAQYWASSARARGYRVGSTPAVGATVVFQPGVQGAGGAGHVAHVEKVYPGGWFLISEMNFYWNGGGWGRVDYRYAHSGYGVSFIY